MSNKITNELRNAFADAVAHLPASSPTKIQCQTPAGYFRAEESILTYALANKLGIPAAISNLESEMD